MNIRNQAMLNTAKIIGTCLAISFVTVFAFSYLTTMQLILLFAIVGLGFMARIVYAIEKSRLEYIDRIEKLSKTAKGQD